MLEEDTYLEPEYGNSRAMTYNWINTLAKLGRVDTTVTADVPTYAVFALKGKRSYVAYNPDAAARKVTFSDGFALEVARVRWRGESAPYRSNRANSRRESRGGSCAIIAGRPLETTPDDSSSGYSHLR